jgi:NADPH:quinone reductase-like Zn-dependent oxidoreductase
MIAAEINKYEGCNAVEINKNAIKPIVSSGKLLVEVYAAGVNPVDYKITEGYAKQRASVPFPITLGGDFSGVIVEVGEGVSGFKKGDEVFGQAIIFSGGSGSFAEFAVANATFVAIKPKKVSLLDAASIPIAGISAWEALVDNIGIAKGQKVLIHGGAGGVGMFGIQIAKHFGAYIATTASDSDLKFVKELGADVAIDYKNQSFETMLQNYDAVLDTIGKETYEKSFKVLKKDGVIVSLLAQPNVDLMNQYGVKSIYQFTQPNTERLSKLAEIIEQRLVKVYIDKTFSLDHAKEALLYLKTGHPRGKVVLNIKNR